MRTPSRSTVPDFDGSTARMARDLPPERPRAPATPASGAEPDRLRTGLVDDVERRLGDPGEPGEPGVGDDPADRGLPGLGAERVAAGLRDRVRQAEERREVVVHAPD